MDDGDDSDPVASEPEEHTVRKAHQKRSTNIPPHPGKAERIFLDGAKGPLNHFEESGSEAFGLTFVPLRRFLDLPFNARPK